MVKCIIFDMDGVLTNTEPVHFELWQQVFRERGVDLDYEHYKGCIGSTFDYLCDLVFEGYGKDFHGDSSVKARFVEIKKQYIAEKGIPLVDGVLEIVKGLKEKGWRMAVASSSPQEQIEFCMKKAGLSDCFELLFSAELVERPKPAPDVFLETAKRLGVEPQECLVVEDSHNGSRAARAAGMLCMGFQNPDSGEQDLTAADEIFYPFANLLGFVEKYGGF